MAIKIALQDNQQKLRFPIGRTALISADPVRGMNNRIAGINRSSVIPIPINPGKVRR